MPDRDLRPCEEAVALHSLAWLAFGNLVGLLLATLLLAPRLGALLSPLTYGRWVPLHLNTHLYGWLGLPLVGLLLRLYGVGRALPRLATAVLGVWSGSLLFGCLSWLQGTTSGKPFLEWSGGGALVLALGTGCLALLLLVAFAHQAARWRSCAPREHLSIAARGVLLLALLPIPPLLYRVSQPDTYPPFNPASGGATGGSLLGSNLVVVAIILLAPAILRLQRRRPRPRTSTLVVVLALHLGWFALLDHGNRSHHEPLQIASLASIVIWVPLLWRFVRAHRWGAEAQRWLGSLATWGAMLVVTGVATFLPGILEAEKFTNALVAHAHIAMAGMASSFSMLVLLGLAGTGRLAPILGARGPLVRWQLGLGLQVAALLSLGLLESSDPGLVLRGDTLARLFYLARWGGGLLMCVASLEWFRGVLGLRLHEVMPTIARGWATE